MRIGGSGSQAGKSINHLNSKARTPYTGASCVAKSVVVRVEDTAHWSQYRHILRKAVILEPKTTRLCLRSSLDAIPRYYSESTRLTCISAGLR